LDERHHRAVESLNFRIRRFDDVIFIGRVRAAAVTESEISGGKEMIRAVSSLRIKLRLGRRFAQFANGRIHRGGHDSCGKGC
jgi:hypothetical protein